MIQALWYSKYRPTTIDGYVFRDARLKAQTERWLAEKSIPHLLFVGPPGVGKTTLAWILAKAMIDDPLDLLYIDTTRDNNVETVQTQILAFCQSGGWTGSKIVFIDEFDNFSRTAQKQLRGLTEAYGEVVRFILTANYAHLIIEPLRNSRFVTVEIEELDYDEFLSRLLSILIDEGIDVDGDAPEVADEIARRCYPDLRAAIGMLQEHWDGVKLHRPGAAVKQASWEEEIAKLLVQDAPIAESRQIIDALRRDEIANAYKYLYDHANELFDGFVDKAIIVIDSHMQGGETASFPNITLCACLIRLNGLRNVNEAGK